MTPPCVHKWQGRPDKSGYSLQRYRCEGCGVWGWRKFVGKTFTPISAYADGRSFDDDVVRIGGKGHGPDSDERHDPAEEE